MGSLHPGQMGIVAFLSLDFSGEGLTLWAPQILRSSTLTSWKELSGKVVLGARLGSGEIPLKQCGGCKRTQRWSQVIWIQTSALPLVNKGSGDAFTPLCELFPQVR